LLVMKIEIFHWVQIYLLVWWVILTAYTYLILCFQLTIF